MEQSMMGKREHAETSLRFVWAQLEAVRRTQYVEEIEELHDKLANAALLVHEAIGLIKKEGRS